MAGPRTPLGFGGFQYYRFYANYFQKDLNANNHLEEHKNRWRMTYFIVNLV